MAVDLVEASERQRSTSLKNLNGFRSAYLNNKCVWIMPTVGSTIPREVHIALRNMAWPMNTGRFCIDPMNMEVGAAYEEGFDIATREEALTNYPWIWTYEQDNIQPQDLFFKLFDAIWHCVDCGEMMPATKDGSPASPWVCKNGHAGLDAIAGLYFTKSDPPFPMAYGDPATGELEFRPRFISEEDIAAGRVMEVNGVAMGSTLWRRDVFKGVSRPWFRTMHGAEPEQAGAYTQDLYACRKLKEEKNARFAVHLGCIVGHLDSSTGRIY